MGRHLTQALEEDLATFISHSRIRLKAQHTIIIGRFSSILSDRANLRRLELSESLRIPLNLRIDSFDTSVPDQFIDSSLYLVEAESNCVHIVLW